MWGKLSVDAEEEGGRQDSHEITMLRREAFSKWLETVVEADVTEGVRKAQTSGNHIDQVGLKPDSLIYVDTRGNSHTVKCWKTGLQ